MKILGLCNFSSGICGVWTRAREEAIRLAERGHEVRVFSSNFVKGSNEIAPAEERIGNVLVRRFLGKKLGGESFMKWDFESEALSFKPDVIIAHSYRHLHTHKAVKIGRKIGSRVFLVTHAPFIQDGLTRDFLSKISVRFYDMSIGPRILKRFDKILAITKWEVPYLLNLGVSEDKIEYVPNGIPSEFFSADSGEVDGKRILFLGRISPIKDIETLIRAVSLVKDKNKYLEIVGPAEKDYLYKLKNLIAELGVEDRVKFSAPIYDINEKIKKIDSAGVFVLPSKSEAMPQSLIEAMARKRIVIASDNRGAKDLIEHGKNGLLFKVGNYKELADLLNGNFEDSDLGLEAKRSVEKFSWDKIVDKLDNILHH